MDDLGVKGLEVRKSPNQPNEKEVDVTSWC